MASGAAGAYLFTWAAEAEVSMVQQIEDTYVKVRVVSVVEGACRQCARTDRHDNPPGTNTAPHRPATPHSHTMPHSSPSSRRRRSELSEQQQQLAEASALGLLSAAAWRSQQEQHPDRRQELETLTCRPPSEHVQ